MTPPTEGERARAQAIAESKARELHALGRFPSDDFGNPEWGTICEWADCIAAALRAPQPSGLTGDAIREAADEVLAELSAMFGRFTDKQRALFDLLRALNLSAIEGAPAAGEREAVDGLLKFWHAILQRLGQSTLDSEVVRDLAETAGLITVTDHDEKTCQLEACVACEEGWSEVYAETEIVAQARRAAYRSALAPASPRSAAPEDK